MPSEKAADALPRRMLSVETLLVLGVSLGASAIWSLLSFVRTLAAPGGLSRRTTSMNAAVTPGLPWLDLAYQLAGIVLALVPVLLALHLMARDGIRARHIGFDHHRPWRDLLLGAGLAAAVGLPGLGFYLGMRAAGLNTTISAAGLADVWWAVPVLILAAVKNAVLEEVVMVGYLATRWGQLGWSPVRIILVSSVIRGTYHLYQGVGGFLGNIAMGVFFGWVYGRTRRVMPLVVAHTLIDIVAFVGYTALRGYVDWL